MKKQLAFVSMIYFMFININLLAQQDVIFGFLRNNLRYQNPAALSVDMILSENDWFTNLVYKNQFDQKDFGPKTFGGSIDALLDLTPVSFNFGLDILRDEFGPLSLTGIGLRIGGMLTPRGRINGGIGFGVRAGWTQYDLDINSIQFQNLSSINGLDFNNSAFNIGAGIFGYINLGNKNSILYSGISSPQVLTISTSQYDVSKETHLYGIFGASVVLNNHRFEAAFLSKSLNPLNMDIEIRTRLLLNGFCWIGVGYAYDQVFIPEIGVYSKAFTDNENILGISYSLYVGVDASEISITDNFGMTHELNLFFYIP